MICTNCKRDVPEYANFCYACGARQQISSSGSVRGLRRLMRSSVDKKIAGVCGGLAEYFGVDSTVIRLACVVLLFVPMPLLPAVAFYIAAWVLMPQAPLPVQAAAVTDAHTPQAA